MYSWEAAFGAAFEVAQKTGVRQKVYKTQGFNGPAWFASKLDFPDDVYRRTVKEIADKWKEFERQDALQKKAEATKLYFQNY